MTKRKMDCSLDNIVMEHLKKAKCEKTSKMFGKECSDGNDHSKLLENFIKFMKQKGTEKENRVEDDLGFEINFESFQPIKKVSVDVLIENALISGHNFNLSCHSKNHSSKREIHVSKKETKSVGKMFQRNSSKR